VFLSFFSNLNFLFLRTVIQRRRGRRARSHASKESLIKDSSSDISPRESSTSAVAARHRQRRAQRSPADQQHSNQAFAEDEQPLPPHIERNDDEEEENIQNADRLVSHVAKQHRRVVNEVQEKNKKSEKKTPTSNDVDDDQDNLHKQIREQQEILSKRVGDTDDDQVLPVEPLTTTLGTTRSRSVAQVLEMAKKSRTGKSTDDGELKRFN
jgi:hypothetical protein